jgi:hypothetical protein
MSNNALVVADVEGLKSLVNLGMVGEANKKMLDLAERHGEGALREVIITQPASALAPMISLGDGNDQATVLWYVTPLQYVQSCLIAIHEESKLHESSEDAEFNYYLQKKVLELLNQVILSEMSYDRKFEILSYMASDDGGRALFLLGLAGIEEDTLDTYAVTESLIPDITGLDKTNIAQDNIPAFFASELSVFGLSDVMHDCTKLLSQENAWSIRGIVGEISNMVEEMTSQKTTRKRANLFVVR